MNSERPREAPPAALVDAYHEHVDTAAQRQAEGHEIEPPRVDGGVILKQSSSELAMLAAQYMDHEDPNVRRLAASVLGQFEKVTK